MRRHRYPLVMISIVFFLLCTDTIGKICCKSDSISTKRPFG
jgi:hypothetical protein